ncbi:ABC transporter permease [Halorientalis brevis]|uniref:ABC transporter permease n=1 Tax=Halorientalis brevis TaxID=1126241 RepID=A0ABD6CB77_9EURY|nr:ABC transporter permease subunit [Halorientalis brevis]
MGTYTVARDDFTNARRSYIVLGVIGVFTALVGLIFASEISIYDDPYRVLWDVSILVSFVFPLFLAPLVYLSIAGDRISGTIKFSMGLPNSRLEYFAGKLVSRFGTAAAAVLSGLFVGFVVSLATYANTPSPVRFATFAAVTIVYALTFVSIFLAISAATTSRARAMFGALGAYFVLVVFWFGFFPLVNLQTVLDAVGSLLGTEISETTRDYLTVLSPGTAYLRATEPVYAGVMDQYDTFAQFEDSGELYGQPWFTLLVMLGWTALSLAVGYRSFDRSELG